MSSYCYSSLPEGSIRLLRLLPHQDERSPIQCQLFDLTLMDSETTYPYEALSYVWGSEDNRQSISVDNCDLHIGANLHAALSHLRDRFLERIIWVDAICINQGDSNEKGQQVLSMARIYAKASCVIVWLGEAAADSDQALEDVRIAAAKQSTKSSMNETNQQAILTLLHRSWFQRIWVLQEVAAARHVLIKCGPTEIDGYAFCSGLSASKLSYATCPDLQALIRSVTYLIRGAIFRPRCAAGGSGRFSLDIRPLSELVEMYHTRKATERHDKVYALLGMSSDDPSAAGLLADYKIPWRQLFQQLVNFFLSERVSVDTWDDKEMAVIQGKGRVLGEVSLVERDTAWEDRQTVEITWRNSYIKEEWVSRWTFQASAKSIQVGDAVCLLQGTSRPTIVRLCNCYWAVIMIAVPPTDDLRAKSGGIKWSELLRSITAFPHDFLLVWDWDMRPDEPNHEAYEYFISNQVLNSCKTEDHLHNATRLGNIGLVLQDMQRYEEAENHLRKAMEVFEEALRSMESLELTYEDQGERKSGVKNVELVVGLLVKVEGGWPLLRWAAEDGHEAVVKLLLGKANPNFKDEDGRTPVLWAATNGHDVVVKLLLSTGKVGLNAKDKGGRTPLLWAAKNGHQTVVKLLLDTGRVDPDAKDGGEVKGGRGRTPLLWAAEGGHEAVVKLLLDTGKVNLNSSDEYGGTPLLWAVKNGHEAVVKLLLDTGKVDPDTKEVGEVEEEGGRTSLLWAANNGHEAVVKLLLDTGKVNPDTKDTYRRTPLWLAAENGHEAVVKLLLDTGKVDPDANDKYERTPLWLAAENGHEAVVKLLLDTGKVNPGAKDKAGRTPILWAARNGHDAVVKLLLETGRADLHSKESSDMAEKVRDMQRQILESKPAHDNFLDIRDEDHFDLRCQQLCSHVQQWVLRFSKFSDMRACRLTSEISDEKIIDRLDDTVLDGSDVDIYLADRTRRRDIFMSMTMKMIWEFVFTRYLFGLDRGQRLKLKSLEKVQAEVGPPQAVRQWRAITLTLLSKREAFISQRDQDTEAIVQAVFNTLCSVLPPPSNLEDQIQSQLRQVMRKAVALSIEMRTQKAEYMMLPPLQPEYNADGDLAETVAFNASLMNERSGRSRLTNDELETQRAVVRIILFPLVVKKGDDYGVGDDEIVVCPAQVLVARPRSRNITASSDA